MHQFTLNTFTNEGHQPERHPNRYQEMNRIQNKKCDHRLTTEDTLRPLSNLPKRNFKTFRTVQIVNWPPLRSNPHNPDNGHTKPARLISEGQPVWRTMVKHSVTTSFRDTLLDPKMNGGYGGQRRGIR
uniref:Uncharacterized protein n=1 Tax=Romanomermis culicivorax TaxID=13658 RepID=A0A915I671_ROMCU